MGGRSSATPPKAGGWIPIDHYLLNGVHAPARIAARKQGSRATNHRGMARRRLLACRSLRHHAGSHSFVLRAEYVSATLAQELDRFLEKSHHASMATSKSGADLAAKYIGPAISSRGILRRKMVKNNPVRHGHVACAEDWPYQGELNILEWHDR